LKKKKLIVALIIPVCVLLFYPTSSLRAKNNNPGTPTSADAISKLRSTYENMIDKGSNQQTPTPIPIISPTPALTLTPTPSPTPRPTKAPTPTPVLSKLKIDHQRLMPVYNYVYGNRGVRAYHKIVSAYLNYKRGIYCSNQTIANTAISIIYKCFPVFISDTSYPLYNTKRKILHWRYTVSRTEHRNVIQKFENRINQYRSGLMLRDCDASIAIQLCRALAESCTYDFAQKTNGTKDSNGYLNDVSGYYMLMNNSGKCGAYTDAYVYLLNQSKINALEVFGVDRKTAAAGTGPSHEWTLLKIDGKYYYADATWESTKSDKLYWFGFTSQFRETSDGGDFPADRMLVNNTVVSRLFHVDDHRFDAFRNSDGHNDIYDMKIDHKNNQLIYWDMFSMQHTFNLSR
jgi:hypothetical protein